MSSTKLRMIRDVTQGVPTRPTTAPPMVSPNTHGAYNSGPQVSAMYSPSLQPPVASIAPPARREVTSATISPVTPYDMTLAVELRQRKSPFQLRDGCEAGFHWIGFQNPNNDKTYLPQLYFRQE